MAEEAISAVAETLAPFRGTGDLRPELLVRSGRQLALAKLELAAGALSVHSVQPLAVEEEAVTSAAAHLGLV